MKYLPLAFVLLALLGIGSLSNGGGRTNISNFTAAGVIGGGGPSAAGANLPPNSRRGGAVADVSGSNSGLSVVGRPSIDVATIRRVLQQYGSPAVNEAETFYRLGVQYNIDPAICLAFFIVESGAGTRGVATETRSVGNIRATPGYVNHRGYRKYATWRDGIEDWYKLISRLYVGEWGLTAVESIVPVYAPAEDNNDPANYVASVRRLVHSWRAV